MWPEPTRTLTLSQLRELARARGKCVWRDETIAHLQALKAAGQPFEPGLHQKPTSASPIDEKP